MPSKNLKDRIPEIRNMLLMGVAVAVLAEASFSINAEGFRISLAPVLMPAMILVASGSLPIYLSGITAGIAVFIVRLCVQLYNLGADSFVALLRPSFFSALYYVWYGLFAMLVMRKKNGEMTIPLLFKCIACDLLSNLFTVGFQGGRAFFSLRGVLLLVVVACGRSVLATALLGLRQSYLGLLNEQKHEERYQKLFLMKSDLKTEVYFMKKSSDQIELVMKNAYQLYEKLSVLDIPESTQKLALQIACDVHDIKKDYIRVTQGIENQLEESVEDDVMSFSHMLKILRESTYRMNGVEKDEIRIKTVCGKDFSTRNHYLLMSVLKNLVTNSIEAIQSAKGTGEIIIEEERRDGKYIFSVTDNGPGIPPNLIRSVFQMGFSTKYDKTSGNVNRGMGLPGVKMTIEEQLGGSLLVSSEPGKRTEFYFEIPVESLEDK